VIISAVVLRPVTLRQRWKKFVGWRKSTATFERRT
jgi:hypothetical protein